MENSCGNNVKFNGKISNLEVCESKNESSELIFHQNP